MAAYSPTAIKPPQTMLDDPERAMALRLKAEASKELGRTAQRRVAAFRSGDRTLGESMLSTEDELRAKIRDLHLSTAPSGLDQTPDQIQAGRDSLNFQLPGAQAAVRGQLAREVDASEQTMQKARDFFLKPRAMTGETDATTATRVTPTMKAPGFSGGMNAMGQSVDTERAIATQRSPQEQGLGQVIERAALRRHLAAQSAQQNYNPPEQINFEPIDEGARNRQREDRGISISNTRRLLGGRSADTQATSEIESLARQGAVAQAGATTASSEADLATQITRAEIERANAARAKATAAGAPTAANVAAKVQEREAQRGAAQEIAGFEPGAFAQNASQRVDELVQRIETASDQEVLAAKEVFDVEVLGPLREAAQYAPELVGREARRLATVLPDMRPSLLSRGMAATGAIAGGSLAVPGSRIVGAIGSSRVVRSNRNAELLRSIKDELLAIAALSPQAASPTQIRPQ